MMNLRSEVENLKETLISLRRDFHCYPELAFEEVRTAGVIAHKLAELGIDTRIGIGRTGVVGLLEGDHAGPTVLLRCDMDALPIQEQGTADYASRTPGKMHACGHDGHTAIALVVAEILSRLRDHMQGRVKFIFQPAEETGQGAIAMIKDGVLADPEPDVGFGLHLWNELTLGEVAVTAGPVMAGADSVHVTMEGKGGHGGLPNLVADPVLAMAQSIVMLQSVVSRNVSPFDTAVISVTQIQAGNAVNVIPDDGNFHGTIRTFNPATRALVFDRLETVIGETAQATGCRATVTFEQMSRPVVNNPEVTDRTAAVLKAAYPDLTYRRDFRTMAAEDVAYFLERVPGVFFLIGSANAGRHLNYPHHHPRFDFDEDALMIGASVLVSALAAYVMPDDPARMLG